MSHFAAATALGANPAGANTANVKPGENFKKVFVIGTKIQEASSSKNDFQTEIMILLPKDSLPTALKEC